MEGFYQITENELIIPGVKGRHEFIHISDTHASCTDELSTPAEIERAKKAEEAWDRVKVDFARHFNEPFNEEHKIPSYEATHKLIEYAKNEKPELLLLSGDILDYIHPAGLRFLKKELEYYGENYLFVPGNHEGRYEKNPCLTEFNRGSGELTEYHGDGFIIAAVDDSNKSISDTQLARLKELSAGSTPVVLLMHIPVATDENMDKMQRFGEYFLITEKSEDANARELVMTLADKNSAVCCILCGHVHGYFVSCYSGEKKEICASSGLVGFAHKFIIKGE